MKTIFLIIGTVLIIVVMLILNIRYKLPKWRVIIISLSTTLIGVLGAKIMALIEVGTFKGTSFYGAVFLIPIIFIGLSYVLKTQYSNIMDLCAPSGCLMLAILKLNCLKAGCCIGKILYINSETMKIVRFPSREVELFVALILFVVFFALLMSKKITGIAYPLLMVVYGIIRFILNWFRETKAFIWFLPGGNFWSLVSILIGIIWLLIIKRKKV